MGEGRRPCLAPQACASAAAGNIQEDPYVTGMSLCAGARDAGHSGCPAPLRTRCSAATSSSLGDAQRPLGSRPRSGSPPSAAPPPPPPRGTPHCCPPNSWWRRPCGGWGAHGVWMSRPSQRTGRQGAGQARAVDAAGAAHCDREQGDRRPPPPPPPAATSAPSAPGNQRLKALRAAAEGKGPQRRPQQRLDRRLEEVAKAVGGARNLEICWHTLPTERKGE